jgi:uncharacterized protein involved in outer membrane biogenesis
MRRILRIILGTLAVLIAIVAIIVVVLLSRGGTIVMTAVNTVGPQMLGVPVSLTNASFSPLRGEVTLQGLHVGNPDGFKTPSLFDVATVEIGVDVASLFRDTIHIRRVHIENPKITYEKGNDSDNISVITDRLSGKKQRAPAGEGATPPPPKPPQEKSPAEKKPEKKVIIDELIVKDPQLNASLTALGGHYLAVSLGTINVKDIGKEQGGVTFQEAIKIIVKSIGGNIENAVKGIGSSLQEATREVKKSAGPLIDAFKGIFGGNKKEKKKKTADAPPAVDSSAPASNRIAPAQPQNDPK